MNNIIVSTDIGSDVDDAISLLVMINMGLPVKYVITTNGNVMLRSFIAHRIINLACKNIKIISGESESYSKIVTPYEVSLENNVDGEYVDWKKSEYEPKLYYKNPKKFGIIDKGVSYLNEILSKKEKFDILSLAPLTNIARLITEFPNTLKNIGTLYIMGCRFYSNSHLEHNIKYDPDAARIVFESNLNVVVVPGCLCSRYRMSLKIFEDVKNESEPFKYVKKMVDTQVALNLYQEYTRLCCSTDVKEMVKRQLTLVKVRDIKKYEKGVKIATYLDDISNAEFEGSEYISTFKYVANQFNGEDDALKKILINLISTDISVADVYIPYVYINKSDVQYEKGDIEIVGGYGETYLNRGDKHKVVSCIEYLDFEKFVTKFVF